MEKLQSLTTTSTKTLFEALPPNVRDLLMEEALKRAKEQLAIDLIEKQTLNVAMVPCESQVDLQGLPGIKERLGDNAFDVDVSKLELPSPVVLKGIHLQNDSTYIRMPATGYDLWVMFMEKIYWNMEADIVLSNDMCILYKDETCTFMDQATGSLVVTLPKDACIKAFEMVTLIHETIPISEELSARIEAEIAAHLFGLDLEDSDADED